MKKKKLTGLNLKKIEISKLQSQRVVGGGNHTRHTLCCGGTVNCDQAPSKRPACQHQ